MLLRKKEKIVANYEDEKYSQKNLIILKIGKHIKKKHYRNFK